MYFHRVSRRSLLHVGLVGQVGRCLLEHDEVQGKAITQVPGHLKLIEHFVRCLVRLSISSAASRTKKIDDTVDLGQYR